MKILTALALLAIAGTASAQVEEVQPNVVIEEPVLAWQEPGYVIEEIVVTATREDVIEARRELWVERMERREAFRVRFGHYPRPRQWDGSR